VTKRRLAALVLLALSMPLAVAANEPPSIKDQFVTTYQNTPATFLVRATDPDIDPTHPDDHLLTFVLLDGPIHGVLTGDFGAVNYEGPHEAYIRLRYVPATDFVGTDFVVLTVMDPLNLTATGTTTIQIDVRPRTQGALSGTVDGWFTFNVQSESLTAFHNRITEAYRVGPLTVQGTVEWRLFEHPSPDIDETRVWFDAAELEAAARFERLSMSALLVFEPTPIQTEPTTLDYFDYILATSRFTLLDVSLTHTLFIDRDAENSYQSLVLRGGVAGAKLSSTTILSMDPACGFAFSSERLTADWAWCEARVRTALTLTGAGFDELYVKLDDFGVPGLSRTDAGVFLDLTARFSPDAKTVTPAFALKTRWIDCIRAYGQIELGSPGSTWIDGVSLYGLRIQQTLGDVRFESSTSFDPSKNASMTGQVDYFELVRISGSMASCCGSPGLWSVATYFQNDHESFMGWGMTVVRSDVMVGRSTSLSFQAAYRTGLFAEPRLELTLGWRVRW